MKLRRLGLSDALERQENSRDRLSPLEILLAAIAVAAIAVLLTLAGGLAG